MAGKLYVRVAYTDSLGKRRELMRRAKDKKHARELKKQLVKQLDSAEPGNRRAELAAQKITFAKVAAAYKFDHWYPNPYCQGQLFQRHGVLIQLRFLASLPTNLFCPAALNR
jgi:hypothetical protein